MFLVAVHSFCVGVEVCEIRAINTAALIIVLRDLFATLSVPATLVTDNGPSFMTVIPEHFLEELCASRD